MKNKFQNNLYKTALIYAVSFDDLANAWSRVGADAPPFEETSKLIGIACTATGRNGAVVGSALKTIFTRLKRREVQDTLSEFGIKTKSFLLFDKSPLQILKSIKSKQNSWTELQKNVVLGEIGGLYQINVLKALIKNV